MLITFRLFNIICSYGHWVEKPSSQKRIGVVYDVELKLKQFKFSFKNSGLRNRQTKSRQKRDQNIASLLINHCHCL